MIRNERIIEIIDAVRDAQITSTKKVIAKHHITESLYPQNISVDIDRWILNDLIVFLQNYRKEIINNDSQ